MDGLVGKSARFAKTVGEFDVYQFAGISGDFYAAHIDEEAMRRTGIGHRIAHGALLVAYMSAASTRLIEVVQQASDTNVTPVSLGYDRIRFVEPVFLGDTITVTYSVTEYDPERRRSIAQIDVRNQAGRTVAVATHLLKWLPTELQS